MCLLMLLLLVTHMGPTCVVVVVHTVDLRGVVLAHDGYATFVGAVSRLCAWDRSVCGCDRFG